MLQNLRHVDRYIFLVGAVVSALLIFLTRQASMKMSQMAQSAKSDPLTGLLNRDGFMSALKINLKKNPGQGIMLMFDVDNFKLVNDELGHPVGDRFLKELALLFHEYFNRNTDICARLGGDEFAVFVGRRLNPEDLVVMLDKFLAAFHRSFDEKYERQKLSVSIGASFAGANTPEEIYHNTDKALYQAKNGGKNCYVIAGGGKR